MIVGFLGFSKSGKDTSAEFLLKDPRFVRVAFADEIKRICMHVFHFTEEQCWGSEKDIPDRRYPRGYDADGNPIYLTPRDAQKQLGTEWGRWCYPEIWSMNTMLAARKLMLGGYNYHRVTGLTERDPRHPGRDVLITDVRFRNEVLQIKAAGGFIFRVSRPGVGPGSDHPSETEQLSIPERDIHGTIHNDGDLDKLRDTVLGVIEHTRKAR